MLKGVFQPTGPLTRTGAAGATAGTARAASVGASAGTSVRAVPELLLTLQMQPVFSQFRKAAPAVRVIAEPRNCYSIGDHLAAGDYDLAVYYDVEEMRDVLDVTPLAQYDLGLFASGEVDSRELDFVRLGYKKTPSRSSPTTQRAFLPVHF